MSYTFIVTASFTVQQEFDEEDFVNAGFETPEEALEYLEGTARQFLQDEVDSRQLIGTTVQGRFEKHE